MKYTTVNVGKLLLCLLMGIVYLTLSNNYNIYYEDDSWTISNVWNYHELDIEEDLLFLDSDAVGRRHIFSKCYNFISGHFLGYFGWSKTNVFLLNSFFIWMAAFIWWLILQQLPFSKKVAELIALCMPIFPPFFFAAHTGRPDALTFLLVSILFLAFIKRYYITAGFLLVMAIETHIMGIIGFFYMLAYTWYKRAFFLSNNNTFSKLCLRSLIGGLLGIIYYFSLHADAFSIGEVIKLINSKTDMVSPLNNYLLTYFTDFDWQYHLPEFIFLVFTMYLYLKNGLYKKNKFLAIFLVVLLLSTFLTRRENRNYMIYVFPAILMMYVYTYEQLNKLPQFVGALLVLLIGYFGSIYYAHHSYDFNALSQKVEQTIQREDLPVVGMPDIWFAAKKRKFYPIHTHRDFSKILLDEFYLIETPYIAHRNRVYDYLTTYFFDNYDSTLEKEWVVYQEQPIRIWKMKRKDKPLPKLIKQEYPGWQKVVQKYFKAGL